MAGISSTIKLYDQMSKPLEDITMAAENATRATDELQQAVESGMNTPAVEDTADAIREVDENTQQVTRHMNESGQQMQQFGNQADAANDKLSNTLSTVISITAAVAALKKAMDFSDNVSGLNARLNNINDGLQSTAELESKIKKSADDVGALYQDVASNVAKLNLLAGDAFSSNDEAIAFVEQMNKMFINSGASATESSAAMYQLTQAMASGRLQGDEYRSIIENAPALAQAMADYLGVTKGELKELSSEGVLSADIIKGALFSAAEETNATFAEMPMTFSRAFNVVKNQLYNDLSGIAQAAGGIAQFIADNAPIITSCIYAIVAAVVAFKVATLAATIAQNGLNLAMLANPAFWVAAAVGVAVYAFLRWSQSVGGFRIAFMIMSDKVQYAWAITWAAIKFGGNMILTTFDYVGLGAVALGVGVVNALGDMKATALLIIQDMVNGAISLINSFISLLNKIPGVSIDLIDKVTFGTTADAANEAARQSRNAYVNGLKAEVDATAQSRIDSFKSETQAAEQEHAARMAEIAQAQLDVAMQGSVDSGGTVIDSSWYNPNGASLIGDIGNSAGKIADNTGSIKDTLDIASEDIKYLRDIAERDVINRFTTADIKVEMVNNNSISSDQDIDGIAGALEEKLVERMFELRQITATA